MCCELPDPEVRDSIGGAREGVHTCSSFMLTHQAIVPGPDLLMKAQLLLPSVPSHCFPTMLRQIAVGGWSVK